MTRLNRRKLLVLTGASLFARPALAKAKRVSTNRAGIAIGGYDTRAYWTKGSPEEGVETFSVDWQGVPWHFASQDEATAFAAAPASFAPKFGGFCTRAMSLKKVVKGDPEVWRIFEGGLYLFARPVGRDYFDKGAATMIAKAQAHWDKRIG